MEKKLNKKWKLYGQRSAISRARRRRKCIAAVKAGLLLQALSKRFILGFIVPLTQEEMSNVCDTEEFTRLIEEFCITKEEYEVE